MSLTGGSFITKQTDPNSIFIAEEWNEEQLMLKKMVHDFLATELHHLPHEPDASKDLKFISDLLEKSAELGLCGLAIKEESVSKVGIEIATPTKCKKKNRKTNKTYNSDKSR